MAESSLVKKLGMKPGQKVLILNAPEDYRRLLGTLPEDVEVESSAEGSFDFVQVFIKPRRKTLRFSGRDMRRVPSLGLGQGGYLTV